MQIHNQIQKAFEKLPISKTQQAEPPASSQASTTAPAALVSPVTQDTLKTSELPAGDVPATQPFLDDIPVAEGEDKAQNCPPIWRQPIDTNLPSPPPTPKPPKPKPGETPTGAIPGVGDGVGAGKPPIIIKPPIQPLPHDKL